MRILHLLGRVRLPKQPDREPASGVVRVALELARLQARGGHHVTVATSGPDSWRSDWEGVRLVTLREWSWAKFWFRGHLLDFRQHGPFVSIATSQHYDIIHSHNYGYLRFLVAKHKIMHFHSDPLYRHVGANGSIPAWTEADFHVVKRTACKVIAVSQFIQRNVVTALGQEVPVHVIPNAVDVTAYDPERLVGARERFRAQHGIPADAVVFLYCGVIHPVKGVLTLARAFNVLAQRTSKAHLVVAGSSRLWGNGLGVESYESEVLSLLRHATTRDRVHMLGLVGRDMMPTVYQGVDVVVIPSIWPEAFATVTLEAHASGKAVIASKTGGLPELVNQSNGFLVEPGNESALFEVMERLCKIPEEREALGNNARQSARLRTWEQSERMLQNLYESCHG